MAAIYAIIFAAAAGFAFVVVIAVIVIIGVRQEERYLTLANRTAPSAIAQLARIVLGRHFRKEYDDTAERVYSDDRLVSGERTIGSRD
jgi:hypothetical protein